MRHTIFPLLFFLTLFLAGCHSSEVSEAEPLRHATLLRMELADSFTRVEVRDAWHEGRPLQTYVLVPRSQRVPSNLPEGILVRTPLKRVVVFSSVHAALLHDLSCEKQLVAMTDTTYAVDPRLKEGLRQGRIADAGSSMAPNVERLLALKPDAVFVPPMEGANYGLLEKAGLTLVQCADYLETSALGRAEWMRFFGRLLGAETQADSLFSDISERYDSLRQAVTSTTERPSLLCDTKQGTAWYTPGGKSYLGQLYADAGAHYLFADRPESGSAALSAETVLARGHEADVWLIKYGAANDLSYTQLATDYAPYKSLRPWQERHIWGCNTLRIPFYEEAPFHPDRLLQEIVKILHPSLLPHHRLRYYSPLPTP